MWHQCAHLLTDSTGHDPVLEYMPGILDIFPARSEAFQLLFHELSIEKLIERLPDWIDSPVQVLQSDLLHVPISSRYKNVHPIDEREQHLLFQLTKLLLQA